MVVSDLTWGMDVCLRSFCVHVVQALRRVDLPSEEGVLPIVYKIHNFKINSFWMGWGQEAQSIKAEEEGQETSKTGGNLLYYITECPCKPVRTDSVYVEVVRCNTVFFILTKCRPLPVLDFRSISSLDNCKNVSVLTERLPPRSHDTKSVGYFIVHHSGNAFYMRMLSRNRCRPCAVKAPNRSLMTFGFATTNRNIRYSKKKTENSSVAHVL
jgi:hypothetical protein